MKGMSNSNYNDMVFMIILRTVVKVVGIVGLFASVYGFLYGLLRLFAQSIAGLSNCDDEELVLNIFTIVVGVVYIIFFGFVNLLDNKHIGENFKENLLIGGLIFCLSQLIERVIIPAMRDQSYGIPKFCD